MRLVTVKVWLSEVSACDYIYSDGISKAPLLCEVQYGRKSLTQGDRYSLIKECALNAVGILTLTNQNPLFCRAPMNSICKVPYQELAKNVSYEEPTKKRVLVCLGNVA